MKILVLWHWFWFWWNFFFGWKWSEKNSSILEITINIVIWVDVYSLHSAFELSVEIWLEPVVRERKIKFISKSHSKWKDSKRRRRDNLWNFLKQLQSGVEKSTFFSKQTSPAQIDMWWKQRAIIMITHLICSQINFKNQI